MLIILKFLGVKLKFYYFERSKHNFIVKIIYHFKNIKGLE